MVHQDNPHVRIGERCSATRTREDLGLSPDLSRLPHETRHSIRCGGDRGDVPSLGVSRLPVCLAMLQAGYRNDEVWTVLTDPANGISRKFFATSASEAENELDRVITEACEELGI